MAITYRSTETARYGRVAIWFHWILAALVIANIAIVELTEDASRAVRGEWMGTHKSIGIAVLAVTLGRIAWRLAHTPPPQPATMKRWEVLFSKTVHGLFYFLLLALPLTGWIFASTNGKPINFFGLFDISALPVSSSKDLREQFESIHKLLGNAMLYLAILHILAALKHQFIDRDGLIGRLNPFAARG
ncbi:cytochrome b [Sphingorhabdus soli]|uniref:Cytochrome b n=1 Tax=Flavisphingopyxis soli TaxID=2601267 RepID=A0A5C6U7L7_9SPHN|nr:cytochrome b [Sphingorhabdus soli]TXC68794.1 cytochrome b [Sphingorhabdus soli]